MACPQLFEHSSTDNPSAQYCYLDAVLIVVELESMWVEITTIESFQSTTKNFQSNTMLNAQPSNFQSVPRFSNVENLNYNQATYASGNYNRAIPQPVPTIPWNDVQMSLRYQQQPAEFQQMLGYGQQQQLEKQQHQLQMSKYFEARPTASTQLPLAPLQNACIIMPAHCYPQLAQQNFSVGMTSNQNPASTFRHTASSVMAVFEESIARRLNINHNVCSGQFTFVIPDEKFLELQRENIDLQLKASLTDATGKVIAHNIWPDLTGNNAESGPSCISVFMNSRRIEIADLKRSLYLRKYCQKGMNTLAITTSRCVCSHYFTLQYVHFKPVRQVVDEIFRRKKSDLSSSKTRGKYPRINIPVRSINCKHTACFDLQYFLMQNFEADLYFCPLCKIQFTENEFEIDQFLLYIISECKEDSAFCEVLVDPSTECYRIRKLAVPYHSQGQEQQNPLCIERPVAALRDATSKTTKRSRASTVKSSGGKCQQPVKRSRLGAQPSAVRNDNLGQLSMGEVSSAIHSNAASTPHVVSEQPTASTTNVFVSCTRLVF
uniref:SP-RING-type domain-containing protein n=1 Tax=Syphacia muris TaxID=451379 RepID=A0A0N5AKZ3_9BILA